jgi:hypothetical protein
MASTRSRIAVAVLAYAAAATVHAAPCADFTDVDDTSPFCGSVTFLKNRGITVGCNPAGTLYCPLDPVNRLAMAAFMNRLADALFPLNCAPGQVMKWNGAAWTCSNDVVGGSGGGGTVTSVLAGTGLQGSPNPITGAGALNIAPEFQLPQGCANGQVAKSNGAGGWTCAADAGGGTGTVTQVNTGTGLAGGPITSTGTVSIAAGGVGTTQLADGAVTAGKLAPGAVGSSALATGLASARPVYVERNIDAAGTGEFVSIVTGVDGLPLIAYYAQSTGDLKVAHCETVDCASTTITTLDSAGDVGRYVSAVVQRDGLVAIAYYDVSNTSLKIAFCGNVRCTTAAFSVVDNSNDVGKFASMTLDEGGFLQISYFDETLDDLKLASCGAAPCSTLFDWTIRTVASTGSVGRGTAITNGFDDALRIAYYDASVNAVRLARCAPNLCDSPAVSTLHPLTVGRVAEGLAITLNHSGAPIVTFIDRAIGGQGSMRIVVCDSADCAAPLVRIGGSTNIEVHSTAVTVPYDNRPVALGASSPGSQDCEATGATSGASGTLRKCIDEACTATATINPSSAGGGAVALNSTGFPIFAWRRCGTSGSRLAVLHCASPTCLGHTRAR